MATVIDLGMILLGAVMASAPERSARRAEQIEAYVAEQTWPDADPDGLVVTATRIVGVALLFVGAGVILFS